MATEVMPLTQDDLNQYLAVAVKRERESDVRNMFEIAYFCERLIYSREERQLRRRQYS